MAINKLFDQIKDDEEITLKDIEDFLNEDLLLNKLQKEQKGKVSKWTRENLEKLYIEKSDKELQYQIAFKELKRLYKINIGE